MLAVKRARLHLTRLCNLVICMLTARVTALVAQRLSPWGCDVTLCHGDRRSHSAPETMEDLPPDAWQSWTGIWSEVPDLRSFSGHFGSE